jgi:hypothetical protein
MPKEKPWVDCHCSNCDWSGYVHQVDNPTKDPGPEDSVGDCPDCRCEVNFDDAVMISNNAKLAAYPALLQACCCALADLEGLRSEGLFPEDEGKPPQVETIEELEAAIAAAPGGGGS